MISDICRHGNKPIRTDRSRSGADPASRLVRKGRNVPGRCHSLKAPRSRGSGLRWRGRVPAEFPRPRATGRSATGRGEARCPGGASRFSGRGGASRVSALPPRRREDREPARRAPEDEVAEDAGALEGGDDFASDGGQAIGSLALAEEAVRVRRDEARHPDRELPQRASAAGFAPGRATSSRNNPQPLPTAPRRARWPPVRGGDARPDGYSCGADSLLRAPVTLPGEGRMRFGASLRLHVSRFTS